MNKLCSEVPEGLSSWAEPRYRADMSHPAFGTLLAQSIRESLHPPAEGQEKSLDSTQVDTLEMPA